MRLQPELEERLERLPKEAGRTKSYYGKEAIRQYVEDREDDLLGIAALEKHKRTASMEELGRKHAKYGGSH